MRLHNFVVSHFGIARQSPLGLLRTGPAFRYGEQYWMIMKATTIATAAKMSPVNPRLWPPRKVLRSSL
jgi:hypothetical protein